MNEAQIVYIEKLLGNDQLEEAIQAILRIANDSNTFLALSARTTRINRARDQFTIDFQEWNRSRNEVLYALLKEWKNLNDLYKGLIQEEDWQSQNILIEKIKNPTTRNLPDISNHPSMEFSPFAKEYHQHVLNILHEHVGNILRSNEVEDP